jgi:hypothetical protein
MRRISVFLSMAMMLVSTSLFAAPKFEIKRLQGAWWSDLKSPTADFAIQGDQVWLDTDSGYHPCRIEGDVLVFDLGGERGPVKNRIISLKGDHLELEHIATKKKWSLTRAAK